MSSHGYRSESMCGGRQRRATATLASVLIAATVAGCGHDASRPSSAAPAADTLLYVWRNFEETGIPDELTVYRDGAFRYRYLLHTQHTIKPVSGRLAGPELAKLRTLVGRTDLDSADASGVKPRRSGYRYVLRTQQGRGTAADGHLHGSLRRLVVRVRVIMDRLEKKSL
jgi:hypothetical protein